MGDKFSHMSENDSHHDHDHDHAEGEHESFDADCLELRIDEDAGTVTCYWVRPDDLAHEIVGHDDVHNHEGESLLESTVEIVTDPPHMAAEVVSEVFSYLIFGALITPLIKRWVRRHDEDVHHISHNH